MDTAQVAGAAINRDRYQLATEITEVLFRRDEEKLAEFGLTQESVLESALRDLSKLFIATISHRPELFRKYVEWQRSVFGHRDIPSAMIRRQIETLSSVLKNHLEEEHYRIIEPILTLGFATLESVMTPDKPYIGADTPHSAIARGYLELLVARESAKAIALVEKAVDEGLSAEAAYLHVIQPVQQEIGRLWQVNELSISQEHYATEASRTLMASLRHHFAPQTRIDTTIVTACLGGELHDMGARMVSDFLTLSGYDSYFVGANTPHRQILNELHRTKAPVLALSATMTLQLRIALDLIDRIRRELDHPVRVVVGGYAFRQHDSLWRDVGADAYASQADEAVETVHDLVSSARGRGA